MINTTDTRGLIQIENRCNFLFKHWLDTAPNIINPVKLISKVLSYSRRNKYPKIAVL